MRRTRFGVIFASLLLATATAAVGQAVEMPPDVVVGRPKLVVSERTVNLGRIREGDIVEAVFTLSNNGDQDLLISETKSTCACTVAELTPEQKRVGPGKSVPIKVTFHSKGYPGQQTRSITVVSNDLDQPQLPLTLAVYVDAVFRMVPPGQIEFRSLRRGETAARSVELTPATDNAALELVSVATGSTSITYMAEPVVQGNRQGYRLSFAVTPEAPVGLLTADARITARVGTESAEQILRIRGEIVGDISALPLTVYAAQPILPGNELKSVRVFSPVKHAFKVLTAEAGLNVIATIRPGKMPEEFDVRLTIDAKAPPGPFGSTLTLRTDHPDQPLIRIPVFGNVAPRIGVEPEMVILSAESEQRRTRRVKLETADLTPFLVTSASVDPPVAVARSVAPTTGQGPYVQIVSVTIDGAAPGQEVAAMLVVKTDLAGAAEVRVPLIVRP